MKTATRALVKLDDALVRGESVLLVGLLTAMTIIVFLQVLYRYVLTQPLHWSEELARYLFVWISMIGASVGLQKRGHFGLEFFFQKLPDKGKKWGQFLIHLLMAALILVILAEGILLVQKTAAQESPAMGMSMGMAYASLPVGAALMAVHMLVIFLKEASGGGAHLTHPVPEESASSK
jgi:TRAP-type C4-dicarboxylate transport system permease small subunit